jgi:hypothetical protein
VVFYKYAAPLVLGMKAELNAQTAGKVSGATWLKVETAGRHGPGW